MLELDGTGETKGHNPTPFVAIGAMRKGVRGSVLVARDQGDEIALGKNTHQTAVLDHR